MKFVWLLPFLFFASYAEELPFGQELVDYINNLNTTWRAALSPRFKGMKPQYIKDMMGVKSDPKKSAEAPLGESRFLEIDLPDTFDAREKWTYCKNIGEVRDQSACGSCWAFGATESMTDRICIASKGKIQPHISAADLLTCCTECGMGCEGGMPLNAWQYWVDTGLVTGSNYTEKSGCRPYPFPPCEHHTNRTRFKPCNKDLYPTPQCTQKCQDSYKTPYDKDKYYGKSAYNVDSAVKSIQKEIFTHGPVEVAFFVYADFLVYQEGVYSHKAGDFDGGHAVKMIGWGTENNVDYWLVVNSWNSDWGENGHFKILRGNNECGIEDGVVAGLPKLD